MIASRSVAWSAVVGAVLAAAGCEPPARAPLPRLPGARAIEEVVLEPNPHSTLSVGVRWTTAEPGTSEVAFGDEGELAWQIVDPTPTTDHRVVVYGLRAERDVVLQVASVLDSGLAVSDVLDWRTGELPPSVPRGLVEVHDPAARRPGWTLANISNRDLDWPPTVVMYDAEGEPVWYAITADASDERGDLDVRLTPTGTVLVGGSGLDIHPVELNLAGEVVWEGPRQEAPEQHHHFERLDDGTTVLLRQSPHPERPDVVLDRIEIIDADHAVVWSWDANDHLVPPDDATGDWLHANAVTVTDEDVYLSCRDVSTIYRIDRATSEIRWALGNGGHFLPDRQAVPPWFAWQHAPELEPDGTRLIYDNHGLGLHTRVLRVAVDEKDRTTDILWEFPGPFDVDPWYRDVWYSPIWGDVDQLDNGNVLVTAGTREPGGESRIFEVTPDGQVVWQMRLPNPEGAGVIGVYRSERIDPPGLRPLGAVPPPDPSG